VLRRVRNGYASTDRFAEASSGGLEPTKLRPDRYRTRPGFVTVTTFTVGAGWDGNQENGWFVGRGLDRIGERFTGGAIFVDILRLSPRQGDLHVQEHPRSPSCAVDSDANRGYSGVTFHAKVKGDNVPLTALGTTARQQTFLNVRGKTLLIRTELWGARQLVPRYRVSRGRSDSLAANS
jgi:hypothetical protein